LNKLFKIQLRTLQKNTPSLFSLRDSSISKFETSNAVSRSLLVSSSTFGQSLLDTVRNNTGLSAANFHFPEYYSALTNPFTYPQYRNAGNWIELQMLRGFVPNNLTLTHSIYAVNETIFENTKENVFHFTYERKSFEKIGGSDVSLNLYDSISDLRDKYNFDKGVSSFLVKNEILIPFLKNAYLELVKRLPKAFYSLEVKQDAEIENWNTLFLYISPSQEAELFEELVQNFIVEWMFKQEKKIKKLVTIADRIF
jgi:hypothetical protein